MTIQIYTPKSLIEVIASEVTVVRAFSYIRDQVVTKTAIEVFAGYNDREGPYIVRLTADVDLANMSSKYSGTSHVAALTRHSSDLGNFFAGWLRGNERRLWGLAVPVLYSADQDGHILTFGSTHDILVWSLIAVQQRIASGLGPNTPFDTSLIYRELCDVILNIQGVVLAPSGLVLKQ
jgi:hypothetical protein